MPAGSILFVNFDAPGQPESSALRKAVRSHATAYSHRVRPRKGQRAAKYKQLQHAAAQKQAIVSKEAKEASDSPPAEEQAPASASTEDGSPSPITPPSPGSDIKQQYAKRTSKDLTISNLLSPTSSPWSTPSSQAQRRRKVTKRVTKRAAKQVVVRPPTPLKPIKQERELLPCEDLIPLIYLPDPLFLSASKRDPFDTYPVPYEPWYGPLLERWHDRLSLGPHLLKCSREDMLFYLKWVKKFEITDPAAYLRSLWRPRTRHGRCMLLLREFCIHDGDYAINAR